MATLHEMLAVGGSIEGAEKVARQFVEERGPAYLLDLQLLLAIQGRFDEALQINDQALENNPNDVRAKFDRGWYHMREGNLLQGFKMLNEGRWVELWGNRHIGTPKPVWQGQDGHVLFYTEAGFGDEIVFIRFVKNLKIDKLTVACSEGMMPLFARIPEVKSVVRHEAVLATYHDYWIPSMGVPVILNAGYKDIKGDPYLMPNEKLVAKYAEVLRSDKLKVGIRWRGNPKFEHEQFRIFPEDLLFDAVEHPHVQAYSLQRDLDYRPPRFIVDMEEFLTAWDDTAAIMMNMDLIVTSCTAIGHLGGALGIPTWIVPPILPYWVWAKPGNKSPWYKSVKLFRQEKFGSWKEPFAKIKKNLRRMGR